MELNLYTWHNNRNKQDTLPITLHCEAFSLFSNRYKQPCRLNGQFDPCGLICWCNLLKKVFFLRSQKISFSHWLMASEQLVHVAEAFHSPTTH